MSDHKQTDYEIDDPATSMRAGGLTMAGDFLKDCLHCGKNFYWGTYPKGSPEPDYCQTSCEIAALKAENAKLREELEQIKTEKSGSFRRLIRNLSRRQQ